MTLYRIGKEENFFYVWKSNKFATSSFPWVHCVIYSHFPIWTSLINAWIRLHLSDIHLIHIHMQNFFFLGFLIHPKKMFIFYIIKKTFKLTPTTAAQQKQLERKIFQTIYYTCNFASILCTKVLHKLLYELKKKNFLVTYECAHD